MNKITWILILFALTLLLPLRIFAQDCNGQDPCVGKTAQDQVSCYENLTAVCKNQRQTLSAQITYMDSQIKLTTLRISATQSKITTLSDEIDKLENEVVRLEGILNDRLALLLKRIPSSYKRASTSDFGALLFSKNIFDFITRIKYVQSVQAGDAALVFQVKATQNSYNDSKKNREDKKVQLEQIKAQLNQQNMQLAAQKQAKDALLTQTKGQEAVYQQLLAEARAQLAAFSGFVTSQGGISLIDADPNWPAAYYSQLDKRWGNVAIAGYYSSGSPIYSIAQAGCLISSVAMVLTHRGSNTTPVNIGTNGSYFFDANFQWSGITSLGLATPSRTTDRSLIDNYLSQNKWVIVGISYTNSVYSNPFHFVVITSKNGSDYNLFDPWRGPNISFNSNYGSNYITEVISY